MIEDSHNDIEICSEISLYISKIVDIDIIDTLLYICDILTEYDTYELFIELQALMNIPSNNVHIKHIEYIKILKTCAIDRIIDIIDHIKFANYKNAILYVLNYCDNPIMYRDCIQDIFDNNYIYIHVACKLDKLYTCPKLIIKSEKEEYYKFCLECTCIKELICKIDLDWIVPIITINNNLELLSIKSANTNIGYEKRLNNLKTFEMDYYKECELDNDDEDNDNLIDQYKNNLYTLCGKICLLKSITKLYMPYTVFINPGICNILAEASSRRYVNQNRPPFTLKELHISVDKIVVSGSLDIFTDHSNLDVFIYLPKDMSVKQIVIENGEIHNNIYIVTDDQSKWNIVYNDEECETPNTICFPNYGKEVIFRLS
jgi:hypothetical protein